MELGSWLSSTFFEKGAFLTDASSEEVILGKGGKIVKEVSQTSEAAFYLKDFFTDKYLIYLPESWIKVSKTSLIEAARGFESPIEVKEVINQDAIYEEDFRALKTAFGENLKKVVLVSREEFRVQDSLEAKKKFFIKSLLFGTGLPYGFWFEDYGVMGSTPELLFSSQKGSLSTFALAGTARMGEEEELLNSQKDRKEHDLVIQDIEEKLAPFCSEIESGKTMLTSYKEMIHLKTNIQASLNKDANMIALASSLSPTAALGGYPKEEGLNFLKQTKYQALYPQRYFGSAFGLITPEMQQFIVSIRNIQWREDTFIIESGGGVLPASELEKELREIELKRNTIKRHYL